MTTTFISPTQLTASVPASLVTASRVSYVWVDGSTGRSLHKAFLVTQAAAPPTSTAAAGGGPETQGAVSAAASGGTGTVSVAQFSANPGGVTLSSGTGFMDVNLAPGNTFVQVQIVDCNLNGGTVAFWFNGSAWAQASNQSYSAGPPACITIMVNTTTSPS